MWKLLNKTLLTYEPANLSKSAVGSGVGSNTIIAFDFDHTLANQKSGKTFPIDADDWQPLYKNIKEKLQEEYAKGHTLVIFTNQGGIEKKKITLEMLKTRLENFIEYTELPIWCFAALAYDHYRKPTTQMWDYAIQHMKVSSGDWQLDKCLYVGDGAGRLKGWDKSKKKDFSCSDRKFAYNVGISFQTPEEYFLEEPSTNKWEWGGLDAEKYVNEHTANSDNIITENPDRQEMIILMGPPGSGKSTFCKKYFPNYVWINKDTLKYKKKCLNAAEAAVNSGKSCIIDNTNPSVKARAEYLKFAGNKVYVRVIYLDTQKDVALHLNNLRVKMTNGARKKLPMVVYHVYYKNLQEPNKEEGIDEIIKVPFALDFVDQNHKYLFLQKS